MAEFKISKAINGEISGVKKSGEKLNDGYSKISSDDVQSLKTSAGYITQHADIKKLLDAYKALVLRDANDLESLVKEANEMDAAISASNRT